MHQLVTCHPCLDFFSGVDDTEPVERRLQMPYQSSSRARPGACCGLPTRATSGSEPGPGRVFPTNQPPTGKPRSVWRPCPIPNWAYAACASNFLYRRRRRDLCVITRDTGNFGKLDCVPCRPLHFSRNPETQIPRAALSSNPIVARRKRRNAEGIVACVGNQAQTGPALPPVAPFSHISGTGKGLPNGFRLAKPQCRRVIN